MNDQRLAQRWLEFAREDLRIVPVLIEEEAFGMACFHAQQAAEKALKGVLAYQTGSVKKFHYLVDLLEDVVERNPDLETLKEAGLILDRYYVVTRYPDAFPGSLPDGLPNSDDAREAFRLAQQIVDKVGTTLTSEDTDSSAD